MNDKERVEVLRGALKSILAVAEAQDLPSPLRTTVCMLAQTAINITDPTARATVQPVLCANCGENVSHDNEHWDDLDGPNRAGWSCVRDTQSLRIVTCPNCTLPVPYASFHCRGKTEHDAYWICRR